VSTIAAGRLYAIDPATLTAVDSFDVGPGAQRVAVAPSGDSVYVANEVLSGVNVVRPSTHTITDLAVTGLPYGLALSADGSRLIVALRASGEVALFDRATLVPQGRIQIGGIPRNVAVDPAGGFVAVSTETNVIKLW
jgi:DNA-binding beta-propeller fold protein YncE